MTHTKTINKHTTTSKKNVDPQNPKVNSDGSEGEAIPDTLQTRVAMFIFQSGISNFRVKGKVSRDYTGTG